MSETANSMLLSKEAGAGPSGAPENTPQWADGVPVGPWPCAAALGAARGEIDAREVLEALPAAVYTTDTEGRITYYNKAAVELSGRTPEMGTDRWCITWRIYRLNGLLLPHDECPMAIALKERRAVRGIEIVVERPDGMRVPVMPYPTPLYDNSNNFVGAVNVLVDITDRKRAEGLVARRVEEQTALFEFTDKLYRASSLESVYDAALDAIASAVRCDRASILLFDNSGIMRFVAWRGLSDSYRRAVEGHSPWKPGDRDPHPIVISDVDAADDLGSLRSVIKAEGIRALAFVPIVANGSVAGKFMAYYRSPRPFAERELDLSLTIARQLGFTIERMRSEEQRTLLIAELNHRVKNTLATIQSIATQTFRGEDQNADARQTFDGRIFALAKAHDVLTRESWEGAALREIVVEATAPYRAEQFAIDGPDLRLKPRIALCLAMALHELCTNAVKYGALSAPEGRVSIQWTVSYSRPNHLTLKWEEENGPPVSPPQRRGFGTRLMGRSLAELGGDVDLSFAPGGVVCLVRAPFEDMTRVER